MPLLLTNKNRVSLSTDSYKIIDLPKILLTFVLVCIAWVFFRANTLTDSLGYLKGMFTFNEITLHFFIKNAKYLSKNLQKN